MSDTTLDVTTRTIQTVVMLVLAAVIYIGVQALFNAQIAKTYGDAEAAYKAGQQAVSDSVMTEFNTKNSVTITLPDGKSVTLKPVK